MKCNRLISVIMLVLIVNLLSTYISRGYVFAQDQNQGLDLGNEYEDYGRERYKKGKGGSVPYKKSDSIFYTALMFVPNRVVDILDIFRVDVGVGPSAGAVIRITPHGQAGARFLLPVSLRAGLRGRRSPIFLEHASEMGIGPAFLSTDARKPSPLEVGAGVDLFIVGFYAGISLDSIWDAFAGFVGYDPADDDF